MRAKPHWHIDYLRRVVCLADAWCVYGRHSEHDWAATLTGLTGAGMPLKGFGSTDCRCDSHLFYMAGPPLKSNLHQLLGVELSTIHAGINNTPRKAGR